MEVLHGSKINTNIYIYDDYIYHIDCRYDNVFRCKFRRTKKCRGSVMLLDDNNIRVLQNHNHQKSQFVKTQLEMKEEMLRLSRDTHIAFKEIFDSVCRSNPDVAQYLSFPHIRSTMQREREKSRPPIPDTLASLCDILENCNIIQNMYKESVTTHDGKTAIILSNKYLLEALSSATELYVDGTFSVLPRKPHIAQLYSVHTRYMDTGIALLFILCDMRTTTMYDALWNKITQLIPQLKQNITFIMSDFEIAAIKSLNTQFPNAKLTGCWFHFNQAVLRKWRKLHLSNVPKTVLSMTMVLPLLPPNMFQEALCIIQQEADLLSCTYPDILQFTSYLRLSWSNMASKISTYGCPIRTNNIVESFHNVAVQKLGTRNINIWTFLEKLSHLISDQELDFRRLKNGIKPRRSRTRINKERDTKIINAQKDLINKRLSIKEFLLMFSTNMHMEEVVLFEDDQSSSDIVLQAADIELFADTLNESVQTERQSSVRHRRSQHIDRHLSNRTEEEYVTRKNAERQNGVRHRRSRHIDSNLSMRREEEDITRNTDQDYENSSTTSNTQSTAVTHTTMQTMQITSHEESQIVNIIVVPETELLSTQEEDALTYEIPEDDYAHLYSTNTNTTTASSGIIQEDLPFYPVNWTFQNNLSRSKENLNTNICTVCYTNERTHIFIPCGHFACCIDCINNLEASRCPICNTTYTSCTRVIRP